MAIVRHDDRAPVTNPPTTIAEQKAALRERALRLRTAFDPAAGEQLADLVLCRVPLAPGSVVAGVWPLPGEMDLRPLLHALAGIGHRVVLPETPPLGRPLTFRTWSPGCPMVRERFGTFRPTGDAAVPDVLFVPLLAFDRSGARLGYGGGYYDRTLAALPNAQAVGFGYAAQEVERVPATVLDYRLPLIVTEQDVICASSQPS